MRRALLLPVWFGLALPAAGQQVVDRIVAHIESDIITESEVRELGHYQQLVQGHGASTSQLLRERIEQWIVRSEAAAARFPAPDKTAVDGALAQLEKQFSSPEAFRARLNALDLNEATVRRLLEQQIYLLRYINYKFRPAARVDAQQIRSYYQEKLAPELQARGQAIPPLSSVHEQIRELLVQAQITELSARWLTEAKTRLKIELAQGDDAP